MDRRVTIPALYLNTTIFLGNIFKKTPNHGGSPGKYDHSRASNISLSQGTGEVKKGDMYGPTFIARGRSCNITKKKDLKSDIPCLL
jgi:hypothetical protein